MMPGNDKYMKNVFNDYNSNPLIQICSNMPYSLGLNSNLMPFALPNFPPSIDISKVIDLLASSKSKYQIELMKQNQLKNLKINEAGQISICTNKIFKIEKEEALLLKRANHEIFSQKNIRNPPLKIKQAILLILQYKNECERLKAMKIKKYSEGACMTLNVSKKTIDDYQMYLRLGIHFNKIQENDFNKSFGKYRREMKKFKINSNEKWDKEKDKDVEEVFGYLLLEKII